MLYDVEVMWRKTIKTLLYVLSSDKTWVFGQSEGAQDPIYILINFKRHLSGCKYLVRESADFEASPRKKEFSQSEENRKIRIGSKGICHRECLAKSWVQNFAVGGWDRWKDLSTYTERVCV